MIEAYGTEDVRAAEEATGELLTDGTLMQRAAKGLAAVTRARMDERGAQRVVALVGSGNNGADVVSTLRAVETRGALRIGLAVDGVLVSLIAVAHDCTPSSRRNRAIPSLMRVLTVPSGVPVRRAISRWVRPVK